MPLHTFAMPLQAVFITTFLFYILALGLGVFYWKSALSDSQKSLINTASLQRVDFAGIALVIGWFSLGLAAMGGEKPTAFTAEGLVLAMFSQLVPLGMVLMIIHLRGVNLSDFLHLRWKQFYLVFLIAPAGVLIANAFNVLLFFVDYQTWMTKFFGDDASQQAIITIYQGTDSLLIRGMMAVMVVIIAPIAEEVIFRGYIYPVTKKYTRPVFAVLMTSLIFGVVHLNISALLPLVFLAIILTLAYEYTGSIWAPISIHALFNAQTVAVLEYTKYTS